MKPKFEIALAPSAPSSLEAHEVLALLPPSCGHHISKGLRLPLGIYNVSVSRVLDKLEACCTRLERYFRVSARIDELGPHAKVRGELIDYIELAIYSAAEHVDDLDSIARGFFRTSHDSERHAGYREFRKEIKRSKRYISACANAIKHQQARIRLFSCEFTLATLAGCLHGYFIEGVENGVVCPSGVFHRTQDVFSITSLAWEILLFSLDASRSLRKFLLSVATPTAGPTTIPFDALSRAVVAAARLPLYTFGEEHPFARATFSLVPSEGSTESLDSGIYGSILTDWDRNAVPVFGRSKSEFEGDGSTKSFRFAQPKAVALHHWD